MAQLWILFEDYLYELAKTRTKKTLQQRKTTKTTEPAGKIQLIFQPAIQRYLITGWGNPVIAHLHLTIEILNKF